MTYKRSLTDSALYCPYCGHNFRMNYDRYRAMYDATRRGDMYALTECKTCGRTFWFRNMSAQYVRESGIKAVYKYEDLVRKEERA